MVVACANGANAAATSTEPADPGTAPAAPGGGQLRAFWVDAFGDGIYTQAQIDQLVADVKAANMNAIVAQVVRRGDCFCNRSSLPRTAVAGVSPAPFDPLQSLIDAAHARGIQVHAWIITTGIWQGPSVPTDPTHAFNQHGPSTTGAANWIDYRSDGASNLNDEYFIDPGNPDAAAYIVNMATSIARNYNVDGINLDRIRYPDGNFGTNVPSWGYNPTALSRFQAATGRTDRPSNTDATWTQWRRDQVTNIVRRIYLETYAIRPTIRISADTITYGAGPQSSGGWENTRTYAEVLQDWVGWLREGILDLNIAMNYKRDADTTQRTWYAQWSDFTKDSQFGRQSAIGSAMYLNDLPSTIRQLRTAVANSTVGAPSAGWNGYSYRTPDAATNAGTRTGASARAELITALTQPSADDPVTPAIFASPVAAPAMPWKDTPSLGQLRGIAADPGGAPIAAAHVTLYDGNNTVIAQRTTDGSGWFGFVDLLPGAYRATIDSTRAAAASGSVTVTAGQVASVAPAPQAHRGLHVERRPGDPAARVAAVGPGRFPRIVVRAVRLSDALPGRALDRDGRLLQLRLEGLGGGPDGRGRVPRHVVTGPRSGSAEPDRRRRPARLAEHRLAAVQPRRTPAERLRRPESGRLVPVHDPGAHASRHVPPLHPAARRGRAVDGGRRRVLVRDRPLTETRYRPASRRCIATSAQAVPATPIAMSVAAPAQSTDVIGVP